MTLYEIISKVQEFTEWIYVLRICSSVNSNENINSFIAFLQSKNISITEENVRYLDTNTIDIAFRLSILAPREVEIEDVLEYVNNLYTE